MAALWLAAPAASSRGASLTVEKAPVVLGKVEAVEAILRIEEPPGTAELPLRLSVNVGSFGEVTRLEAGVYRATYTPPPTRFPQVALVAAWRETGPEAPIQFMRLPLWGTTRVEAMALPGSEVRVEVGEREFGPTLTGAKGSASVPVEVAPNVPEAVIRVKEKAGQLFTRRAVVKVPDYNRVTLALVPHAVLANGEDWVRLDVFYDAPGGVPVEKVHLTPTEGTATLIGHEEPGRFTYKYLAKPGSLSREVSFHVSVEGDAASKSTATVSLGLPPAAQIALTAPPKPIIADGHTTAAVQVKVYDAHGLGLPHQSFEVMAGGQLLRAVDYKGSGLYEARLVAPATYPAGGLVRLTATLLKSDGQALTSSANYQVLPLPLPASLKGQVNPRPLEADGKSKAIVALDVRDRAGLPLKGAQLIALASHGTVSPVLELGEGRYRIEYHAPDSLPPGSEALLRVVDSSNSFEAVVPVALRKKERLLVGARVGLSSNLGEMTGVRAGLDALVPLRLFGARFAVDATASFATASRTVRGAVGASRSDALYFPLALRLAYLPYLSARLSTYLGAGPAVVLARVVNDANGYRATKAAAGAMVYGSASLSLGPGEAFAELSWTWASVEHPDFRLDAGGLGVEIGYRIGLF
jgi:hypothetical protein